MIRWTSRASTQTCDGLTRRDFLHAGALGALGLTMGHFAALRAAGAVKKDRDERLPLVPRVAHALPDCKSGTCPRLVWLPEFPAPVIPCLD